MARRLAAPVGMGRDMRSTGQRGVGRSRPPRHGASAGTAWRAVAGADAAPPAASATGCNWADGPSAPSLNRPDGVCAGRQRPLITPSALRPPVSARHLPPSTAMSTHSSLKAPTRPTLSKRASSSASFLGQLKNLQSPTPPAEEIDEIVVDPQTGKSVIIRHSGIVRAFSPATASSQRLVATLFQRPTAANAAVSDLAIYEFTQLIDALVVPYVAGAPASTKVLDATAAGPRVVEVKLSMPSLLPLTDLRRHESLFEFEAKWSVDVVLQQNDVFRRHKRLAVFDMDSTLIAQEVIDELAAYVGVASQVSAITARAMNGELDFTESLRQRVALLRGVPADVWDRLKADGKISFSPGAVQLCTALKRLGFRLAVISGGFKPLAQWVAAELHLDYAFANELVVSPDGRQLTGELVPGAPIINAERKEELLRELAAREGVPLRQTLAVGDGANDLKMLRTAGLGVAWNAKPIVQEQAPCKVNGGSLRDILYLMGFTKAEQEELLTVE